MTPMICEEDPSAIAAFAVIVAKGYLAQPQAIRALLVRRHFQPLSAEERAAKPIGWATARGSAWLLSSGEFSYTQSEVTLIRAIARQTGDYDQAEREAPQVLRLAADELDDLKAEVGRELRAAIGRLGARDAG